MVKVQSCYQDLVAVLIRILLCSGLYSCDHHMSRRTLRTRNTVNYSDLNKIDGISDEEVHEKEKGSHDDSGEEFEAPAEDDQVDEDEEMEDEPSADEQLEENSISVDDFQLPDSPKSRARSSPAADTLVPSYLRTSNKSVSVKPRHPASLKERFRLFFGYKEQDYVAAVKERSKWAHEMFYPDPEVMMNNQEKLNIQDKSHIPETWMKQQELSLEGDIADDGSSISVQFNMDESTSTKLNVSDSAVVPASRIAVINLGASVTSLDWAPGHNDATCQYLAVSVIKSTGFDPLNLKVLEKETSALGRSNSRGLIHILEVDTTNSQAKVAASYVGDFGTVEKVQWWPSQEHAERDVGLLSFCSGDGALRLLNITKPDSTYKTWFIRKPILEYNMVSPITTFTWRTDSDLLVGMVNGSVAELCPFDNPQSNQIPSFEVPISTSAIASLVSAYPDIPEVFMVSSTDTFLKVLDVRDLRRSRTSGVRTKHFIPCTGYSTQLKSFLALEDNTTMKVVPIRRMHTTFAGTGLTRHHGSITGMSSSLLHPFTLSVGADGAVRIGNAVRRVMVNSNKGNEYYKCAKLCELTVDNHAKTFSLNICLEAENLPSSTSTSRPYIWPASLLLTDVKWCQNLCSGSSYAVGSASGLLVLENLEENSDMNIG